MKPIVSIEWKIHEEVIEEAYGLYSKAKNLWSKIGWDDDNDRALDQAAEEEWHSILNEFERLVGDNVDAWFDMKHEDMTKDEFRDELIKAAEGAFIEDMGFRNLK